MSSSLQVMLEEQSMHMLRGRTIYLQLIKLKPILDMTAMEWSD